MWLKTCKLWGSGRQSKIAMQTGSFSRAYIYIYTPMVDLKKNAMVSLPAMHRSPQMKRGQREEMQNSSGNPGKFHSDSPSVCAFGNTSFGVKTPQNCPVKNPKASRSKVFAKASQIMPKSRGFLHRDPLSLQVPKLREVSGGWADLAKLYSMVETTHSFS